MKRRFSSVGPSAGQTQRTEKKKNKEGESRPLETSQGPKRGKEKKKRAEVEENKNDYGAVGMNLAGGKRSGSAKPVFPT